ncbi:MAG: hypothetical protein JNM56_19780 [Planctomycetia bacterium]|nr:hypothetical protein [Planctomycetia bacterium]
MRRNHVWLTRREFAASAATFALAPALAQGDAQKSPGLRAGAAEAVVTPDAQGTFLIGPMKPSTGVHDDLYARALVLAQGEERAVIVTLDYLGFDFAYNDVLLTAISRASGIPASRVLIACSHNHSAPLTAPWGPWEKAKDKPFHEMLPRKLGEIVQRAAHNLQPARLRVRREPTQIGFNRRMLMNERIVMAPNPQGAVLPWVDVLAVETREGKPIAVLFSHAAHPVIVHGASTQISADYPGFAVQTLRSTAGKEAVYLFAQGCCGNINAFPLRGGIEAAAAVGRDLGQAVGRALQAKPAVLPQAALQVASEELTLPLQAPPPVEVLRDLVAREKDAERKARRQKLLALAESGRRPTMRFPMRGIALGTDLCILGIPHDVFAEYHQFANKVSPFAHTLVFAYTNGLECYVGTAKDYELGDRGGYETSPQGAALMFESGLPLAAEAEAKVQAGLQGLLRKLKSS